MKSQKLKVWGSHCSGRRELVAARTQKQAIELTGQNYRHFKDYWSETGNELELATANEVGLWRAEKDRYLNCGNFEKVANLWQL